MAGQVAESRHESLQQPQRPKRSLEQHRTIADAIHAGEAKAAVRAMRRHLRTVSQVRLLAWNPDDQQG